MVAPAAKPAPRIVTSVPPAAGPALGATEWIASSTTTGPGFVGELQVVERTAMATAAARPRPWRNSHVRVNYNQYILQTRSSRQKRSHWSRQQRQRAELDFGAGHDPSLELEDAAFLKIAAHGADQRGQGGLLSARGRNDLSACSRSVLEDRPRARLDVKLAQVGFSNCSRRAGRGAEVSGRRLRTCIELRVRPAASDRRSPKRRRDERRAARGQDTQQELATRMRLHAVLFNVSASL